MWLIPNFINLT
ncbi:hypothetical protein CISIN_1g0336852mg, partial [Citrus sinensis]